MSYAFKSIVLTIQGEGAHAGRACILARFAGCNLWSGRDEDRAAAPGSCARWCDTDFRGTDGDGGGVFKTAGEVAAAVLARWPQTDAGLYDRWVVVTGGEPLLQLDAALTESLHLVGFRVAVETNGTLPVPWGVDWLCVSPKAGQALVVRRADELKLVYPQQGLSPDDFAAFESDRYSLSPMDGADRVANTRAAIAHCLANPRWRVSTQQHKAWGIP